MDKRPFTISIEGNVGAGKSTLLNYFLHLKHFDVIEEPIRQWQSVGRENYNLLQLMYDDPIRHGCLFQFYEQLTRVQTHSKSQPKDCKYKIMERSIYTARHCFIPNLKQANYISKVEFSVLDAWFQYLTTHSKLDMGLDLIIYLKTTPEVAWERVKLRARKEEECVSLEYIKRIHLLHEQWLCSDCPPCKVMTLDVDQDVTLYPKLYLNFVKELLHVIQYSSDN